nr:hypothetical protein [Ktedonobacteraceae bacterium]
MRFRRLLLRLTHLLLVSLGSCLCLLTGLLLTSCSSASTAISHATPTATTASTVVSRATPVATTGPVPVSTPLASPPSQCALKPPPQVLHLAYLGDNTNVLLVGGSSFWIYSVFYPRVLHMAQFGGSPQWPMTKMVVEVGPNYDQPVTLRLREMRTGALAWWTDGQAPPTAATHVLVLNPQTDSEDVGSVPGLPDIPHGSPAPGWKEWGIFPLFSVAGCYALEVNWSGGSWQSNFAVGS